MGLLVSIATMLYYSVLIDILGTGKTLVAAALANEINRENLGKVSFFHRKGAECLDKWLGESEKKLKDLFDKVQILYISSTFEYIEKKIPREYFEKF